MDQISDSSKCRVDGPIRLWLAFEPGGTFKHCTIISGKEPAYLVAPFINFCSFTIGLPPCSI
jgi:hypothetical protein